MKANQTNQTHEHPLGRILTAPPARGLQSAATRGLAGAITDLCLGPCQKVLAQVWKVKDAIFAEWRETLRDHQRLLRLALNEAEAMAFETDYPHLLFPAVAAEKARAVADWAGHQKSIR
jgi:hypothetical protein